MLLHGLAVATVGLAAVAGGRPGLPAYVIGAPDILRVELTGLPKNRPQVRGEHLVRPDGTVSLGEYGEVRVAGLTARQAQAAVAAEVAGRVKPKARGRLAVRLDVVAFNSKCLYVVGGAGGGEQVVRLPYTGVDTVLDVVAQVGGLLPAAGEPNVWVARPTAAGGSRVLPVDWAGITRHGHAATNYQLLPGDRVHVTAGPE